MSRFNAHFEQPSIGCGRVLDGGGKRVHGSQPIIETEYPHRGLDRQPGHEIAMGLDRAGHIAAAVQIEHYAIAAEFRSFQPFRTYPSRVHRLVTDVAGEQMTIGDLVILRSQLRQAAKLYDRGTPSPPRESAKLNNKLKFPACHLTPDLHVPVARVLDWG